jgi:hypothetical protein
MKPTFSLDYLPFKRCLYKHRVFLAFSGSENRTVAKFSKIRFLEKKDGPSLTHEKCHFLLGMDFLAKKNKPNLKFYMKTGVLRIN